MIKITSVNRKLLTSETHQGPPDLELQIMDTNCNAVIAVDRNYNKGHFELLPTEAAMFEEFCQQVEHRIVREIADHVIGLTAITPLSKPEDEKATMANKASA